jgi:hypothetical protein
MVSRFSLRSAKVQLLIDDSGRRSSSGARKAVVGGG